MVGVASGTRYGIMVGVASTVGVASVVSVWHQWWGGSMVGVASMMGSCLPLSTTIDHVFPFV